MKYVIRLIALPLVFILNTTVIAADMPADNNAPVVQSTKIGVLDWQLLLTKAPQAEEAGKRLEKEFQGRKDTLIAKQKDFQTKQEKLGRDKDVMSATDRTKGENELAKLQQDLRRLDEELRSDYTARHREEMDAFLTTTREVVDALAKEQKYDLVLPQDATIYVTEKENVNITDAVLGKLKLQASAKSTTDSKSKK